jgi:hypothetical protein
VLGITNSLLLINVTDMKIKDLADNSNIEYVNISSVGVNSIAFTKENALLMAKVIRQENIPISGGDVYFLNNGQIVAAQDNWSCEKTADETLRDYTERSYRDTIDYITQYGEERISYFWKIPIRKRRNQIFILDGIPLFDIVIPIGKELFGCLFY